MSWIGKLTIDGIEFYLASEDHGGGGVIVPFGADLEDEEYCAALARAQALYPTYCEYMYLDERRYYWYSNNPYNRKNIDRLKTLDLAWKYYSQKDLSIPEWLPKFMQDLRDDTPAIVETPRPVSARKAKAGYVYLLQQVNGAHYKIGHTKDPESRNKTFGIQLPFAVEFICLIKSEDMTMLEAELHQRFAEQRVNGEWFALSPEDIEYIKGLTT